MSNLKKFVDDLNLDDYKRDAPTKLDAVTTSLHLDRRHMTFVHAQNLNLSRLVRDLIDTLIQNKGIQNEDK